MTEREYVESFRDNRMVTRFRRKLHNLHLIIKYPFLNNGCGLCSTYLDNMPKGWRIAFGLDMCRDLKKAIKADGLQTSYKVYQVKEKYGQLRWYDNAPCPSNVYMATDWYTGVSESTCVECGDVAEWMSVGYICPFCNSCKERHPSRGYTKINNETF